MTTAPVIALRQVKQIPIQESSFYFEGRALLAGCAAPARVAAHRRGSATYSMTGIENSPPSLVPEGQREVTVLVRV